ncbi:hypothetical protein Tco_1155967 [Tanacetum coccineum]
MTDKDSSAAGSKTNEVHSNDNQIFDNVDYQLSQEMHQEEHLDSDAETEIDDNTIPYHQYLLDTEAQNVPTEVSADTSDKVSMIAILTDLQTQLDGHAKVNQEKCLEIETLKNELLQCKQEICRLDTHKVKLDLENKVRQEQALVIQRNKRNAELVQENDLLKSTLSGKEKSIAFLQSEKEKILSEKKDLADSYLDEIVCLKNANKVARDMLQRFNMPTQTIPMLSKKPKKATNDLHKDILGTRNPGLGYMAKRAQPVLKGKPTFQLVDEDDEAQQESIPHEEGNDPDLERAKKMSLEALQEQREGEGDDADLERAIKLSLDPAFLPQGRAPVGGVTIRDPVSETTSKLHEVVGKGKAVVTEEQVAHSLIDLSKKKRTTDQFILVRRDQTPPDSTTGPSSQPDDDTSEKVIHESSSTSDSERTESDTETAAPKDDKDQGEVDSSTVTSGVSIPVSDPVKAHEALAGPDPEPMKEDQTGSDSGKLHVSLAGPNPEHMDDEFLATAYPKVHENLKLITDERVIDDKPESHSGSMSSMKNLDDTFNFGDQFLYDKPTEDDQDKSKVREESESTIPDPDQTVTSTPPVIAPFIRCLSSETSLLVTRPTKSSTEAQPITTSLPENYSFTALQLNRRNTLWFTWPESDKNQDLKESTDEVDIEEFDLKSALFSHMNKKKSANKNKTNYRLYHALMEALIADEDAMDKEVADKVKDHKRKHDSDDDDEDDDDDEGPSAGSNQGTKRRRSDSAASGSAKPPPKADDQSSKKPRESEASASKQHPTLSSTGWQITDTREAGVDSSMHRSDPESEHSEQSSDDISMQDEGNVSDMEDTDNAHIPKVSTTTWFKPIPESERPATPEPEWTIPPNDFPEPEHNWANAYATTYKAPEGNKLQRKTKGFQKLPSNDFEDLFLLNIQEKLNHLPQDRQDQSCTQHQHVYKNLVIRKYLGDFKLGIESYQTKINLERPTLVMQPTNYFKEDYTKTQSQEQLSRHRPKLTKETDERLHELHKFLVMVT